MKDTHHAIRVDHECNADKFWGNLRDAIPGLAVSLKRNGCAVVSTAILSQLADLDAFDGEPSPLIDYGTEGQGYLDVVSDRHSVYE